MLRKLLVANRGEIAVRVIRAARSLGVPTVAVYSDADRTALHVGMADEAVRLGPAEARLSYLDGRRILEAAAETGALVVGYRCHANSFMLLLERPVPTVAHRGELGSAGDLPPAIFWKEPEFWARWDSPERVVALVRDRDRKAFLARSKAPVRVLGEVWGRFLAANYPEAR